MEHPFINDLSNLTLEQLQEKLTDIASKLNFAYRTGNGPLIQQLQMVHESYKKEHGKRLDEIINKSKNNTKIDITKK